MRHNSKLNRLTSQISSPLKVSSLPLATSIITMSLCLLFSVFLVKSVHAEDIYETDYGTYASNLYSDVTDIINSDFIIRTSGSFRYLRYPVSRTTVDGDSQEKSFNYLGAGADIALFYCKNSSCFGIDQTLSTIYTYKNSGNHFIGSSHIEYLYRQLLASRLLLQYGGGIGLNYASNSNKTEEKVFLGNGLALSLKFLIIATFFFTHDIGAGLNIAPTMLFELGVKDDEKNSKHLLYGVDVGIHFMFKY